MKRGGDPVAAKYAISKKERRRRRSVEHLSEPDWPRVPPELVPGLIAVMDYEREKLLYLVRDAPRS